MALRADTAPARGDTRAASAELVMADIGRINRGWRDTECEARGRRIRMEARKKKRL